MKKKAIQLIVKNPLMSPLVPEGFNDVFQELLVSEKVWLWDWNYLWEFITNPLVKPMPQPTGTVRFVDPFTGIVTGKLIVLEKRR